MGSQRFASNNKEPASKFKKGRRKRTRRAEIKKKHGSKTGCIEPESLALMTEHHLKKRRSSARANIDLSGKKKRKLMKQIKHMQKDKSSMEVVAEVTQSTKNQKKIKVKDTDMPDVAEVAEEVAQAEPAAQAEDQPPAQDLDRAEDAEEGSDDEAMED